MKSQENRKRTTGQEWPELGLVVRRDLSCKGLNRRVDISHIKLSISRVGKGKKIEIGVFETKIEPIAQQPPTAC
jgi:hypothetical protein